jgi:hypothetical protein
MFATQIDVCGRLHQMPEAFRALLGDSMPRAFLIAFKSFFRVSRLARLKNFLSVSDNTDSIIDIKISGSLGSSSVRRLRYVSSRASIDAFEYGERRCSGVSRARAALINERRIWARPARLEPLLLPAALFRLCCSLRPHGGSQPACFAASCKASWSDDGGMAYGRNNWTSDVLGWGFARDRVFGDDAILTHPIAIGTSVRRAVAQSVFYRFCRQNETDLVRVLPIAPRTLVGHRAEKSLVLLWAKSLSHFRVTH